MDLFTFLVRSVFTIKRSCSVDDVLVRRLAGTSFKVMIV